MRPVTFKLRPIKSVFEEKKTICFVEIIDRNDTILKVCGVIIPMDTGEFVMIETKQSNRNKNKVKQHRCHRNDTDEPPGPCHDSLWELVYTKEQLEGEALLVIMLDVKNKVCIDCFIRNVYNLIGTNLQADLRTHVTVTCEGIMIEDVNEKIMMISAVR